MIHQYKCVKCDKISDIQVPAYTPPSPKKCENCGGRTMKYFGSFYWKRGEEYPRYNVQLGKMVKSRHEEDAEFSKLGATKV